MLCHLPAADEPYQLDYVVSKFSGKYLVRAWLMHLAWQCSGAFRPTYWLFLDQPWQFQPLVRLQAEQYLQHWLSGFYRGLQQPLLLAVESALVYAQHLVKGKNEDEVRLAALKKWREESNDVFWRQVLPEHERDYLPRDFAGLAQSLYLPLLEHGARIKWAQLQGIVQ